VRLAPSLCPPRGGSIVPAKKVLVVDDSPTVRQQVADALSGTGLVLLEACDGAEGLTKIESDREIGLVILDVNMPRMNGLEMLEAMKMGGKNAAVQVVMLTGEGQQSLIERAKKAGARGWIVKPFKPEHLVAAIKRLLAV
jgi:two-component system, chemotaxis family, chemotaxis protein CheY